MLWRMGASSGNTAACTSAERATERLHDHRGHHGGHPFGGLEQDVAGESVGDDHVQPVGAEVPAFDVADEVDGSDLEQVVGLLLERTTFALSPRHC
jgi:hypothetical protein